MPTFWSAGMTVLTALGAILLAVAGVAVLAFLLTDPAAVVGRAVPLAAGSAGCAVLGTPGPAPDRWACVAAGVVLAMANHLIPAWRGAGGRNPGRTFR